jgi:hypothetical protein
MGGQAVLRAEPLVRVREAPEPLLTGLPTADGELEHGVDIGLQVAVRVALSQRPKLSEAGGLSQFVEVPEP